MTNALNKNQSLPYLTADQLRKTDLAMINHYSISIEKMMECAGLRLAEFIRIQLKLGHILILAGKGHNGGDGFVAARHLSNWGYTVSVILSCQPESLAGHPKEQFEIISKIETIHTSISSENYNIQDIDLIIDCLLGFGITGTPRGQTAELIKLANNANKPIIALDIPSGLDTTTGEVYFPCIKAQATLSLAMLKTGFQTSQAQQVLGKLYLADIGVPNALYEKEFGIETPLLFKVKSIISL